MGWASEKAIEIHKELMESDEDYRAEYESEMFEQWRAEEYFRKQKEEEIYENFFGDYRISFDGYEETDEPTVVLIDEDIPF